MKFRATYALVILNVLAFAWGLLVPLTEPPLGLVLYGFSHASWWHLGINMVALLGLGLGIERTKGAKWFLGYYMAVLVTAGLFQLVMAPSVPVVGASGAVFGLLVAYAYIHPARRVVLLVVPMMAKTAAVLYVTLELCFAVTGTFSSIAHWCHVGGAGAGFLILILSDDEIWGKYA